MRLTKLVVMGWLLWSAAGSAWAFSLLGPYKGWQTQGLGYQLPGDIGGPMTLVEDYRWNITNVFFAMDASFLNYFGARGEQEINKAFDILNALPAASAMTPDLREFPLTDVTRINYRAEALRLMDIKSLALHIMLEQMGLADPKRFMFSMRARTVETRNNVTWTNYTGVRLNYDPVTIVPTDYLNGTPFGFQAVEPIQLPGVPDYADYLERPLDPVPFSDGDPTPVASGEIGTGEFYIALSRDDAGGLRWLLRPGNVNTETIVPGAAVATTNRITPVQLTNQDLRTLVRETSRTTNDLATVLALYPDLRITSSNAFLSAEPLTNRYWILTNSTDSPTGHVQYVLDVPTNVVMTLYDYTYDNVVTNLTHGSVYIIPPALLDYEVVGPLLTNVVPVTNLVDNPADFFQVNTNIPVLLTNHDLSLFALRTVDTTNDTAALLGYYPDLIVTNTNVYYSLIIQTNISSFFTNLPFVTNQVVMTNIVTNAIPRYNYQYANLFTNVIQVPVQIGDVLTRTNSTNVFILPTNYVGYQLVTNLFYQSVTNVVTNTLPGEGWFIDYNAPTLVTSSNLAFFNEVIRTNSSTNLLTIFPDLVITNTAYTFGVESITNYFFYLTNAPFAPAGALIPVFYPVVTNVIVTNYTHAFANVVTNNFITNSPVILAQESVYRSPFAPADSLILTTNWTYTQIGVTNSGDYYIIPTNLVGFQLIRTLLTNSVVMTNYLQPMFSSNFAGTNVAGTNLTSTNIFYTNNYLLNTGDVYIFAAYAIAPDPGTNYFSLYTNHYTAIHGVTALTNATNSGLEITDYTNVISAAYPIEFQSATNSVNLRPGVEKVHFVNVTRNYDSLIGQFFTPITNQFVENVITNSQLRQQVVRRVLGEPDVLFVSEDLGLVNGLIPVEFRRSTATNWINNDALNGSSAMGGPGVIAPPVRISYTDQYPYFRNQTPLYLDESHVYGGLVWGSFDGTTNAPVVYPDYYSISNLEHQILNPTNAPTPP